MSESLGCMDAECCESTANDTTGAPLPEVTADCGERTKTDNGGVPLPDVTVGCGSIGTDDSDVLAGTCEVWEGETTDSCGVPGAAVGQVKSESLGSDIASTVEEDESTCCCACKGSMAWWCWLF